MLDIYLPVLMFSCVAFRGNGWRVCWTKFALTFIDEVSFFCSKKEKLVVNHKRLASLITHSFTNMMVWRLERERLFHFPTFNYSTSLEELTSLCSILDLCNILSKFVIQPEAVMKPKRKSSTPNIPRISQLPADVIGLILTFLPVKEAARTSILSTQWRHHWRSIPHLVFDGNFATIDSGSFSELITSNKLVMLQVYQALLLHDGPINKFQLSIPRLRFCPQLHQLVTYLSTKSVNELPLLLPDTNESLPSSLFAIPNLISLKLEGFFFEPPTLCMGFSKLTLLELNDVQLTNDFFEKFLLKCPLLQELRILECYAGHEPVFVVTSSVKVLLYHSTLFRSFHFKYTPHLSVLSAQQPESDGYGDGYYIYCHALVGKFKRDMVDLFGSLPALEHLNLGLELLLLLSEDNDVPYQLPAPLPNLKVVQIPCILLGRLKEARVLACLIRSSPNLQKLTIGHNNNDRFRSLDKDTVGLQKLLEPEDQLGVCCLQQLEVFNIQNCRLTRVELDLLRIVLATAPKLKSVSIKPMRGLSSEIVTKFLVEVTRYKRISKEAEVKYLLANIG